MQDSAKDGAEEQNRRNLAGGWKPITSYRDLAPQRRTVFFIASSVMIGGVGLLGLVHPNLLWGYALVGPIVLLGIRDIPDVWGIQDI